MPPKVGVDISGDKEKEAQLIAKANELVDEGIDLGGSFAKRILSRTAFAELLSDEEKRHLVGIRMAAQDLNFAVGSMTRGKLREWSARCTAKVTFKKEKTGQMRTTVILIKDTPENRAKFAGNINGEPLILGDDADIENAPAGYFAVTENLPPKLKPLVPYYWDAAVKFSKSYEVTEDLQGAEKDAAITAAGGLALGERGKMLQLEKDQEQMSRLSFQSLGGASSRSVLGAGPGATPVTITPACSQSSTSGQPGASTIDNDTIRIGSAVASTGGGTAASTGGGTAVSPSSLKPKADGEGASGKPPVSSPPKSQGDSFFAAFEKETVLSPAQYAEKMKEVLCSANMPEAVKILLSLCGTDMAPQHTLKLFNFFAVSLFKSFDRADVADETWDNLKLAAKKALEKMDQIGDATNFPPFQSLKGMLSWVVDPDTAGGGGASAQTYISDKMLYRTYLDHVFLTKAPDMDKNGSRLAMWLQSMKRLREEGTAVEVFGRLNQEESGAILTRLQNKWSTKARREQSLLAWLLDMKDHAWAFVHGADEPKQLEYISREDILALVRFCIDDEAGAQNNKKSAINAIESGTIKRFMQDTSYVYTLFTTAYTETEKDRDVVENVVGLAAVSGADGDGAPLSESDDDGNPVAPGTVIMGKQPRPTPLSIKQALWLTFAVDIAFKKMVGTPGHNPPNYRLIKIFDMASEYSEVTRAADDPLHIPAVRDMDPLEGCFRTYFTAGEVTRLEQLVHGNTSGMKNCKEVTTWLANMRTALKKDAQVGEQRVAASATKAGEKEVTKAVGEVTNDNNNDNNNDNKNNSNNKDNSSTSSKTEPPSGAVVSNKGKDQPKAPPSTYPFASGDIVTWVQRGKEQEGKVHSVTLKNGLVHNVLVEYVGRNGKATTTTKPASSFVLKTSMKPAISIEEAKDTSTGGTAEVLETQAKETSTGAQEDESLQMEGLLLDQILGTYDASQDAAKTGDTVDQAPVMSCSIKPEEGKQGGGEAKAVKEAPETEEGQGGGEDTAAKEARDKKNARKRAREEAKKVEKQNAPKKAKK